MARHKDSDWTLPEQVSWQTANLAVLMDIRDELKTVAAELNSLNRLLNCRNFLHIPRKLERIANNTRSKLNGKKENGTRRNVQGRG
jgi:hypothetical protein